MGLKFEKLIFNHAIHNFKKLLRYLYEMFALFVH